MRIFVPLFLLLASLGAGPAAAQQTPQPRVLAVPATAGWQHARTGTILMSRVAGLARSQIADLGEGELDIVAQYQGEGGVTATVYLFQTQVPDAALWFDRALSAILNRPEYGLAGVAAPAPELVSLPAAVIPTGLRVALDTRGSDFRSTGVAIVPVGSSFLLKIRMSAATLDRAALAERLGQFIAALRWPAAASTERPVVPVADCAAPLRTRRAQIVRADGASALLDAVAGLAVRERADQRTPVYCRDPGPRQTAFGVYRANGSNDAYILALNDAGIALGVAQAIDLSALTGGGGGRRYSVTLLGRGSSSVLPSFNRLPPPEQVLATLGNGPVMSVSIRPRQGE